jgi:hypothetical protein
LEVAARIDGGNFTVQAGVARDLRERWKAVEEAMNELVPIGG